MVFDKNIRIHESEINKAAMAMVQFYFLIPSSKASNLLELWEATYKWNANYAAAHAQSEAEIEKIVPVFVNIVVHFFGFSL